MQFRIGWNVLNSDLLAPRLQHLMFSYRSIQFTELLLPFTVFSTTLINILHISKMWTVHLEITIMLISRISFIVCNLCVFFFRFFFFFHCFCCCCSDVRLSKCSMCNVYYLIEDCDSIMQTFQAIYCNHIHSSVRVRLLFFFCIVPFYFYFFLSNFVLTFI